ncbi:MAG: RNA polymerase sigma factor [Bacteroidales bacterium]|nr:RNA polymerase sigma factor [Bacteroidales bacterium]MBN2756529.1 RNA polymerase sigma factor [Bacteroidales bacterium]
MTLKEYNNCVDNFSDNLYRFILKNIKNEAIAEDVVQDSFEILWINHENLKFEKAKSYLFSTGYHKMIDQIRKNKKFTDLEDKTSYEQIHEEQYSDIQEILNNAISQLPEIQKHVLLLRDYEGYSYKEISEITNITETQVKVYIYRARVFLKNIIVKVENLA